MSSFVKTTDTFIFHIREHRLCFDHIEHFILERIDRREHICRFDVLVDIPGGALLHVDCSSHYENRTSVVLIDAYKCHIMLDVTISKAEKPDNGTYMIRSISSGMSKCFIVFILGRYRIIYQIKACLFVVCKLFLSSLLCNRIITTIFSFFNRNFLFRTFYNNCFLMAKYCCY